MAYGMNICGIRWYEIFVFIFFFFLLSERDSISNYQKKLFPNLFHFLSSILVVNASESFYNGTTAVPVDKKSPHSPKRTTKTLNCTVYPEEKRKIIGDTFMHIADDVCRELDLHPEDTLLAQGMPTKNIYHMYVMYE